MRSLTLEDKRTLLVTYNIVHVLPDVTTPNRDCKSLKQGINWLRNIPKSRLKNSKENSSVGDKNAGIL